MTSATPIPATDEQETGAKRDWVEPRFSTIDVGMAEAGDGSGPDSGFIAS